MTSQSVLVQCPKCGTRNRVPKDRWGGRLKCGKCEEPLDVARLYPDRVIDVTDASFRQEVADFPGPVLIDFTASW